jgi:hypothetical protein
MTRAGLFHNARQAEGLLGFLGCRSRAAHAEPETRQAEPGPVTVRRRRVDGWAEALGHVAILSANAGTLSRDRPAVGLSAMKWARHPNLGKRPGRASRSPVGHRLYAESEDAHHASGSAVRRSRRATGMAFPERVLAPQRTARRSCSGSWPGCMGSCVICRLYARVSGDLQDSRRRRPGGRYPHRGAPAHGADARHRSRQCAGGVRALLVRGALSVRERRGAGGGPPCEPHSGRDRRNAADACGLPSGHPRAPSTSSIPMSRIAAGFSNSYMSRRRPNPRPSPFRRIRPHNARTRAGARPK